MSNEVIAAIVLPVCLVVIGLAIWAAKRSVDRRTAFWREYGELRGFTVPDDGSWMHKHDHGRDVLATQRYVGPSGERRFVGVRLQVRPRVGWPAGLHVDRKRWDRGMTWLSKRAGTEWPEIDDPELTGCFPAISANDHAELRRFVAQPLVRSFFLELGRRGDGVHVLDGMLTLDTDAQVDTEGLDAAQATLHDIATRLETRLADATGSRSSSSFGA
jgi:hypothetical protein